MSNLNCQIRDYSTLAATNTVPLAVDILRNMRNNIRNMRNSSVLTALFPHVRQGVLAATLTQPSKWWYLSELADRLGTTHPAFSGNCHPWWQAAY